MLIATPAILVAVRSHGEHDAIIRALTPEQGLQAGYVRGGRSRRLRPVLQPGNAIEVEFRARTEEQLAAATVELAHSRAPLLSEPLPAAAIDWACAFVAASLPEGYPCPRVYAGLSGLLDAIEHAPSARGWAAALVRFEQLVLAELGYEARSFDKEAPLAAAIRASGQAIAAHLLTGKRAEVLASRERLMDRLKKADLPNSRSG